MRHPALLIVLGLCLAARPGTAQTAWRLTFSASTTSFSPAAQDTSADPVQLRPWHPVLYSLAVTRDGRRIGAGLGVTIAAGEVGANVGGFAVLPGQRLDLVEVAPELRWLARRTSTGAELRVRLGPVWEVWWGGGLDPRHGWGAKAGALLMLPVTGRWDLEVATDLTVARGLYRPEDADPGITINRTMRRTQLGLGIARRI